MTGTFADSLVAGTLDWRRLREFPVQDPRAREVGDAAVETVTTFLRDRLDPDEVDRTAALPPGFVEELRASGLLKLGVEPGLGGQDLPPYSMFRAIEAAVSHSTAAGQMLAVQAGVSAAALLPALAPGPLRDFVGGRIEAGAISGFGLTEPAGQNNSWPGMTATPTADGTTYLLRGDKIFTGHGPVADLLPVAATEHGPAGPRLCVCFVDTRAPGFTVRSDIEFTGSKGLPNGALRFDDVPVPSGHVVRGEPGVPGFPAAMQAAFTLGQLYFTAAPAAAIARLCRDWSGEFVTRRQIDGRELGDYDQIQRIVAATVADVHAIDSAVRWSLLAEGRSFEQVLTKNLAVRGCWRVVDRTISLFGGEGVETAESKRRRGAHPVPLERRFRDARGLRVAGNVDFRIDTAAGRRVLDRFYTGETVVVPEQTFDDVELSAANRAHLGEIAAQVRRFHDHCRELVTRHPDPVELFARQHTVIQLGRIAAELFSATAVLGGAGPGDQEVTDAHCVAAAHRLAGHWAQLCAGTEPDYGAISAAWLKKSTPNPLFDARRDR
jgi:alkylation response protein AidB-like acyl-CoA dehydrogenase